jgi:hypothetical protein
VRCASLTGDGSRKGRELFFKEVPAVRLSVLARRYHRRNHRFNRQPFLVDCSHDDRECAVSVEVLYTIAGQPGVQIGLESVSHPEITQADDGEGKHEGMRSKPALQGDPWAQGVVQLPKWCLRAVKPQACQDVSKYKRVWHQPRTINRLAGAIRRRRGSAEVSRWYERIPVEGVRGVSMDRSGSAVTGELLNIDLCHGTEIPESREGH